MGAKQYRDSGPSAARVREAIREAIEGSTSSATKPKICSASSVRPAASASTRIVLWLRFVGSRAICTSSRAVRFFNHSD